MGRDYRRWFSEGRVLPLCDLGNRANATICETGFNYGSSAFAFVRDAPGVKVLSWDLVEAASHMKHRCDLIFVDGGHMLDVALADIVNFKKLAKPGALLLVDDCDIRSGTGRLFSPSPLTSGPVSQAVSRAVDEGIVNIFDRHIRFEGGGAGPRGVCVGR